MNLNQARVAFKRVVHDSGPSIFTDRQTVTLQPKALSTTSATGTLSPATAARYFSVRFRLLTTAVFSVNKESGFGEFKIKGVVFRNCVIM